MYTENWSRSRSNISFESFALLLLTWIFPFSFCFCWLSIVADWLQLANWQQQLYIAKTKIHSLKRAKQKTHSKCVVQWMPEFNYISMSQPLYAPLSVQLLFRFCLAVSICQFIFIFHSFIQFVVVGSLGLFVSVRWIGYAVPKIAWNGNVGNDNGFSPSISAVYQFYFLRRFVRK